MPRCMISQPTSNSINRYLPRRSDALDPASPRAARWSPCGIGQRKAGVRTSTRSTRCPVMCGDMPRRVTSTSGNSGILNGSFILLPSPRKAGGMLRVIVATRVTINGNPARIFMDFSFAGPSHEAVNAPNFAQARITRFSAAMLTAFSLMVSGAQAQQSPADPDDDSVATSVVASADPSRREGLAERRIVERDPVPGARGRDRAAARRPCARLPDLHRARTRDEGSAHGAARGRNCAARAEPVRCPHGAQLWHQFAPNSSAAGQLDASLLVLNGKLDDAQPLLAAQLADGSRGSAHQRDRLAAVADFTRAGSFGRRQAAAETC